LFAERRIEASSLRTIAKAAGVSVGLVQHHLTSKASLVEPAVSAWEIAIKFRLGKLPLPEPPSV
jgi:AcrR family transcriptional regulator